MQIEGDAGETYMAIASSKVSNTEWVQLKGKFTPPDDATALSLYVESTKPTESFYIDNVVIEPLSAPAE